MTSRKLTKRQLERGVSLAERERVTRWEWGDWAVMVAGPVGERGVSTDAIELLTSAVTEVALKIQVDLSDLPTVGALRHYRLAADAVPPKLRDKVRSIHVGELLSPLDVGERHELITRLASEHPQGLVTVDATRLALDKRPTNTGRVHNPDHLDRVKAAEELLADPDVAQEAVASALPSRQSHSDLSSKRYGINTYVSGRKNRSALRCVWSGKHYRYPLT